MQDIFSIINNFFEKKEPVTSESGIKDVYMINRWLSMHWETGHASWVANTLSKLPPWAIGCFIYHNTPKRKQAPRIAYVKKDKREVKKIDEKVIKKLCDHFCCSKRHAEEIYIVLEGMNINVKRRFGVK